MSTLPPLVEPAAELTRDEVAANQKQRLFKALGAVMGVKGYSNTTVDD